MSDPTIYAQLADVEKRLKALERQEGGDISGAWTIGFAGSTIAGTFTYSTQVANYVRSGNVVFVYGFVGISAVGVAATGNLRITGLPFTSANVGNGFQALAIAQYNTLNLTAGCIDLGARVTPNGLYADLMENFDNAPAGNLPGGALAAGSLVILGGSYIAEA